MPKSARQRRRELTQPAARAARITAKTAEQQYIERKLAAMNLPEFMERTYSQMRSERLDHKTIIALLGFEANKRVVEFMDLPPAKKRILSGIMTDSVLALRSVGQPIMKKHALRIIDRAIKGIRAVVREQPHSTNEQIQNSRALIRNLKLDRADILASTSSRVSFAPQSAINYMALFTKMMYRICGRKNTLLINAAGEAIAQNAAEISSRE